MVDKKKNAEKAEEMNAVEVEAEEQKPVEEGEKLEAYLAKLEKRADVARRLATAAIAVTRPQHWESIQGNPYLKTSAATWIASALGIQVKATLPEYVQADEGEAIWICEATATIADIDRTVTAHGACPASQAANAPKKAESGAIRRAVMKVLGIEGITWEQIQAVTGTDPRTRGGKKGGGR